MSSPTSASCFDRVTCNVFAKKEEKSSLAAEKIGKDSSSRAVKVLLVLGAVAAAVALAALAIILIPAAAPVVAAVGGAVAAVTTLAVPSFVYPTFFGALSAILFLSAFLVNRKNAPAAESAPKSDLPPLGDDALLSTV